MRWRLCHRRVPRGVLRVAGSHTPGSHPLAASTPETAAPHLFAARARESAATWKQTSFSCVSRHGTGSKHPLISTLRSSSTDREVSSPGSSMSAGLDSMSSQGREALASSSPKAGATFPGARASSRREARERSPGGSPRFPVFQRLSQCTNMGACGPRGVLWKFGILNVFNYYSTMHREVQGTLE